MAKLVTATYGDALYELAVSGGLTDTLYEEAGALLDVFEENSELMALLNHPKIVREDRISIIENSIGKFVSKEMTGFLVTIADKDRCRYIPGTLSYFIERIKEYKGIGTAYVTTPSELTDAMKANVESRLLKVTHYNRIDINYSIDKSLIGGMVIRIGDRVVDSSIKHKLAELSRELNKIDV